MLLPASSLHAPGRRQAIEGVLRIGGLVIAAKQSIISIERRVLTLSDAFIAPEKLSADIDGVLQRLELLFGAGCRNALKFNAG